MLDILSMRPEMRYGSPAAAKFCLIVFMSLGILIISGKQSGRWKLLIPIKKIWKK